MKLLFFLLDFFSLLSLFLSLNELRGKKHRLTKTVVCLRFKIVDLNIKLNFFRQCFFFVSSTTQYIRKNLWFTYHINDLFRFGCLNSQNNSSLVSFRAPKKKKDYRTFEPTAKTNKKIENFWEFRMEKIELVIIVISVFEAFKYGIWTMRWQYMSQW